MAVTADGTGKVTGHFTIPAGVPAGTKLVEFAGQGGTKAAAYFTGRGQVTVTELRAVQNITTVTTTTVERYDPLAETFTLGDAALVSSVDVWPVAKGASGTTLVEIRECENGVPTPVVVVSARKPTASLPLNQWVRFAWDPVRLEQGREYAVVMACDDALTRVAVAELGKFDASQQKWVTQQPYQVGVLLSSSNGSTWTAHQDKDLTFRLNRTPTAAASAAVAMPDLQVAGCDELMVLAGVERPTPDCDVRFRFTLPLGNGITADNRAVTVGEGERVLLPATVTGTINWAAVLSGTADATPRLHPDVEVVWGTRAASGTYVSRALPAGAGSKVSDYFEGFLPGTSSVRLQVADTPGGAFVDLPFVSGTQIGDGWVDFTYRLGTFNPQTAVLKITLAGDARNRPMLRKFRGVVS